MGRIAAAARVNAGRARISALLSALTAIYAVNAARAGDSLWRPAFTRESAFWQLARVALAGTGDLAVVRVAAQRPGHRVPDRAAEASAARAHPAQG
jgi:hypothetical protein